jgi:hypothetical protein
LYFVSNLSLATQCALEIFSGLIQALADSTKSLGELTTFEEIAPEDATSGSKLLYDMSKVLVSSGLVPNIEEANAIIIPPFARRRLLNRGPDRLTSAADVQDEIPPLDPEAYTTLEAKNLSTGGGTAVEAQVQSDEVKLDQSSVAIALGASSSQNVSEVRGMEVKEPTPEDETAVAEAKMPRIEVSKLSR